MIGRSAVRLAWCLGFSIGWVLYAGPSSAQEESNQLLVATYNIHAGKDADGVGNLLQIGNFVRETDADLLLLQEVDRGTTRSGNVDQVVTLAEDVGYRWAFGETLEFQGGQYGIAVLSRWPVSHDTLFRLPVDPAQERAGGSYEPRGALYVVVETPFGKLNVFNTHLDPSPDDYFRTQEVETVLQLASSLADDGEMVVVGGDFNSLPGTETVSIMTDAGFRDSFSLCGAGEGLTYPSQEPVKRIDYLFMSEGITCSEAVVPETEISDHRPLVVSLSMEGNDE